MRRSPADVRLRRFSLEQYEPRRLLSVAPVSTPQIELASQFVSISTSSAIGQSNGLIWFDFRGVQAEVMGRDGSFGYGTAAAFANDGRELHISRDEIRGIIQPPVLDPIAVNPVFAPATPISSPHIPYSAPIDIDMPMTPQAPFATGPVADRSGESGGARKPVASEATPASSTRTLKTEAGMPTWLAASFSPVEQQRLDVARGDVGSERLPAGRDPQSRLALVPTHVNSQTVCVVSLAQTSDGDALDSTSGLPALGSRLQVQGTLRARSTNAAADDSTMPAIHDAALLQWASESPANSTALRSLVIGDALPTSAEASIPHILNADSDLDGPCGGFSAADIAGWLSDHKQHLLGVILAVISWEALRSGREDTRQEPQQSGSKENFFRKLRKPAAAE